MKYYSHVVAAIMKKGSVGIEANKQVSHLCHIPGCVNPDHLTIETERINKTRWCCMDYLGVK